MIIAPEKLADRLEKVDRELLAPLGKAVNNDVEQVVD
jgi:hypothetical protein